MPVADRKRRCPVRCENPVSSPSRIAGTAASRTTRPARTSRLTNVSALSNVGISRASASSQNIRLSPLTIVTSWPSISRLVVAAEASLFDNVGNGHQHKINKASAGDTASMLYQTNYSGRAEIGLTGDDKFHFKVSANGSSWTEAFVIDPATGYVGIGTTAPEGPLHVFRTSVNPIYDRVDDLPQAPAVLVRKARGIVGARTAVVAGDVLQSSFGSGYDGASYVGACNLRWVVDGPVSAGNVPTRVEFFTFTSGGAHSSKLEITSAGTTRPAIDNAFALGDATHRWAAIYAANGTIQTSDAREKSVVGDLTFAAQLVDAIDPVLFKWTGGGNRLAVSETETEVDDAGDAVPKVVAQPVPGTRMHAGFLAQDLKAAMDAAGVDFGAWGLEDKDNPDSRQWTRPDQLIAVLWAALKETRADVAALRRAAI